MLYLLFVVYKLYSLLLYKNKYILFKNVKRNNLSKYLNHQQRNISYLTFYKLLLTDNL